MNIDLEEKKSAIRYLGNQLFTMITRLPREIRKDTKPRTGIQIFTRVIGTRNQISLPIRKPSKDAKIFVVEKSVRTEIKAHKTSQDSRDPSKQRYGGCISIFLGEDELHVSISGLKEEEDVAVAIIIMSKITGIGVDEVIKEILTDGGKLPDELFREGHYLNDLLNVYR
mgnify:CR=1 FL=1